MGEFLCWRVEQAEEGGVRACSYIVAETPPLGRTHRAPQEPEEHFRPPSPCPVEEQTREQQVLGGGTGGGRRVGESWEEDRDGRREGRRRDVGRQGIKE